MGKPTTFLTVTILTAAMTPPAGADEVVLQNRFVRRVLIEEDGQWRTQRFERAAGGDTLRVDSEEFQIKLMDGTELTVRDFRASGRPVVARQEDRQTITIHYVPRSERAKPVAELEVRYALDDEPYLRKQIRLHPARALNVDRLQVERFKVAAPCTLGGRGQPVFVGGSWFFGLEYPGAETAHDDGLVTLAHFPGSSKVDSSARQTVVGKTGVAGVGAAGDPLELAFGDYLETIRRPSRILLHYNSWYDLRSAELSSDRLLGTFDAFRREVLDPYNLTMDVFVPDDGWQDPQSIWQPRPDLYPDGFAKLARELQRRGTRLGIWLPFNGYNLDVAWGARQGYEKSDRGRYYCLAGPKYNTAIRAACERIITQGNVAYFKHDFNQLRCTATGHGHLPDERHGHEANLDAELELLAFERALQPDAFLNVTSYVWHSPWWLQHADSIWMAAGDFGYNLDWPQLSPREWAMSYRDAHFYTLYREQQVQVPLSAMMTHGIIHGRYQLLGGEAETLREWADYVVLYYGRGVQLMEWYITPDMMSPQRWEILGQATRWAIENRDILRHVVQVGGDPRRGEAYGYAHWTEDRGLLVLRNPDVRACELTVPFDKSVRYRGRSGVPFRGRVIYPFVEALGDGTFRSGTPIRVALPGCSVMVYELTRGSAPPLAPALSATPLQATAGMIREPDGRRRVRATVQVPDEPLPRCDLYLIQRRRFGGAAGTPVHVNGAPVTPRPARGGTWSIQSVDLRSWHGQTAQVTFDVSDADGPFRAPATTVSAWLVADRAVATAPADATAPLPPAVAQHHRRQTVELLADTFLEPECSHVPVTASDLAGIQAARLRIVVFDSNGEPRYRDKFIYLNEHRLVRVPPNTGPLSSWQEHVIELAADQLELIRLRNVVVVDNPVGDYFKFGGLALAVQLSDGRWAATVNDDGVHSSIDAWSHAEGTAFTGNRSAEIVLAFD